MGTIKRSQKSVQKVEQSVDVQAPVLARRSLNRKSTMRSGRTIAAKREQLETAAERAKARKKDKKQKTQRFLGVSIVFATMFGILIWLLVIFFNQEGKGTVIDKNPVQQSSSIEPSANLVIVDEDASSTGGKITARMKEYIALVESDFAELGYTVEKVVLPINTLREVNVYLAEQSGYFKMVIDRGAAVSVEDADRMVRFLKGQGIANLQYIDVRVKGKAFYLESPN